MNRIAGVAEKGAGRHPFRWDAIRLLILLLCLSSLGMMTIRQWQDLRKQDRYLDVSLNSKSTADYSARRPTNPVAQVGAGIIGDMIHDSQPDPADLPARLASGKALLNSPIPGATPPSPLADSQPSTDPPVGEPQRSTPKATRRPYLPDTKAPERDQHNDRVPEKSNNSSNSGKSDKSDKPDKSGRSKKN